MRVSFWSAVEARDALIDGDLARVHERTNYLATQRFDALPERWRYWLGEMQTAAREGSMAPNTDEAAQWVAEIALSCGSCHGYSRQAPERIPQATLPPAAEPEALAQRMQRHAQAAQDLWVGLAEPSDAAWQRGARTLNEASPQPPVHNGEPVDPAVLEQLDQVKAFGLRAVLARTPHQRAQVYGELLARCPRCHTNMVRPHP